MEVSGRTAQVKAVYFKSFADHTEVILQLRSALRYSSGRLSNPSRLYFDLIGGSSYPDGPERQITVDDNLVQRIRIRQRSQGTRIVLDLLVPVQESVSFDSDPPRMTVKLFSTQTVAEASEMKPQASLQNRVEGRNPQCLGSSEISVSHAQNVCGSAEIAQDPKTESTAASLAPQSAALALAPAPQSEPPQTARPPQKEPAHTAPPPESELPQADSFAGEISGIIRAGKIPVPGVEITAANTLTGQKVISSTDTEGHYSLTVPGKGRYVVRAELAIFATVTKEVLFNGSTYHLQVDFEMMLLSRAQAAAERKAKEQAREMSGDGFQSLTLSPAGGAASESSRSGLPGYVGSADQGNLATESVAVSGNLGSAGKGASEGRSSGFGGLPGPGGFGANKLHGGLFYSLGDSALDAKSYSLTGQPVGKPGYSQQRFGLLLGGPLRIPKIYSGQKTFLFAAAFGARSSNLYDAFATVPTAAERSGDLSAVSLLTGSPVSIYDPLTSQRIPGSQIPSSRISSAATGLLKFIPLPNLPGEVQNFHYLNPLTSNFYNVNSRLLHSFGSSSGSTPMGNSRVIFGLSYYNSDRSQTNIFPTLGGTTSVRAIDLPMGIVHSFGHLTNTLRFDFNRKTISTENLYAFSQNIEGDLGIRGVSQNPFDWGVPNLSFTHFSSVSDVTPLMRSDQTATISEAASWSHGGHTLQFGGDFRRMQLNVKTDTNARGSFIFTGFATAAQANGAPVPGTGFDFADFLLGLPQQTSVQFGGNSYYFRGNSWNLYLQDEWRAAGNLMLNLGVRYEYVSPFKEKYSHIVNLDAAPGFTAVAPVLPGQTGPFSGPFPETLINADRNNFAPRVGIAWKPFGRSVVRAGYGIDYNTTAYANFVQQLAFQPPFAFTQTNIASAFNALTLESGFPQVTPSVVTNNFGVDRNYRLGYVQIWNLGIQEEITPSVILSVDYTGSKGTALDTLRAPNRGPAGLRIPNVQPFLWASSEGDSILHAANLRVRKQMERGLSLQGTYTFSKSIDNASSIGGGASVVAQDDQNLTAERGLSSFDQRQRLVIDYVYELPLGSNKRFLSKPGFMSKLFGDWQVSGSMTAASGTPFTARVLGDFGDVSRGTYGTLRANATGQPISLPHVTIAEFFNAAAFTVPPPGQFGNAARNIIIGPKTVLFEMAVRKTILSKDGRSIGIRAEFNNVFNTPQWTAIDTAVNSPSYGRVISVGPMRRVVIHVRFHF